MKEQLYTIPLIDAFKAGDECPFCFIERSVEHDLLDFVLGSGSSYMEADIREQTDNAGFCRAHFQKMFDYGNTLGNAWILKTHYQKVIAEMKEQFKEFLPPANSLKNKFRRKAPNGGTLGMWAATREDSCYICNQFQDTYERYLDTFFYLYRQDPNFRDKIAGGKGFCLHHFGDLCTVANEKLKEKELEDFFRLLLPLMERNMERVAGDVAWMVEKFDYRNKDADWRDSRDSIQRGMQKLKGGYPADPAYKMNK